MEKIYFFHQDPGYVERQSDGLEFLIIPELNGDEICFYCDEHDLLALSLKDFSDNKFISRGKSMNLRSATLKEICNQGFSKIMDSVKHYDTIAKKRKYIQINNFPKKSNKAFFFSRKDEFEVIFCEAQNFHDGKIYFYSPKGDFLWRNFDAVGIVEKSIQIKNKKILPASIDRIFETGHDDLIYGVSELNTQGNSFDEIASIFFKPMM